MAYAAPSDLRARYREATLIQLADADDWVGAEPRLSWALETASTFADGHVAKYFAKGASTTVPPLLIDLVCQIAFYHLYEEPTDKARDDKKAAEATLGKIAAGLIKLDEGDPAALEARDGAVVINDPGRVFSREKLGGF